MITSARTLSLSRSGKESSYSGARFANYTALNSYAAKTGTQGRYADRRYGEDVANIAALFEPDVVASAQYFDNFQRNAPIQPENRLLMAILEDAIRCFQDNILAETRKSKKLFDDAEEWVFTDGSEWIFSFHNVCELLGIDPEYLRAGLIRWKQQHYHSSRSDKGSQNRTLTSGSG
jgi:hypothetical protein